MKKVLVLLSSILMTGCFICQRTDAQEKKSNTTGKGIVTQQSPIPQGIVVTRHTVSEAANFEFDSKELIAENNKIDEIAKDIQAHPDTIIYVEGHTDNIGEEEYNRELSLNRAYSVAKELVNRGVSAKRIRIHGAGSSVSIASNDTEEGRKRNRRVDVVLIKR